MFVGFTCTFHGFEFVELESMNNEDSYWGFHSGDLCFAEKTTEIKEYRGWMRM
jgi:hypothetical protein